MSSESDLFEEQENNLSQHSQVPRLNNTIPKNTFRQKATTLAILIVLIVFFWYLNQEQKSFHPRSDSGFLFNTHPIPLQTKKNFERISQQKSQTQNDASKDINSLNAVQSQTKPKNSLQKLKQEIQNLQKQLNHQTTDKPSQILGNEKQENQQTQKKDQGNQNNLINNNKNPQKPLSSQEQETTITKLSQKLSQEEYESKIYAGQIHFSRIPIQYWQHRILMIKSMGLNTLSVYVMWNYHEIYPYKFDYQTQNRNITHFLQLAKKHSMKVLLRPGPYICGQWDFGGLPARLLGIKDLKIRSYNQLFLKQVQVFFKSLAPLIKPYLLVNGGPIKLVQIQNELGSLKSDLDYTLALVNMWQSLQIKSQFYIQDSAPTAQLNYWKGAAIGLSGGNHPSDFQLIKLSKIIDEEALVFGGEIYSGWMTHWGERWGGQTFQKFKQQMAFLIITKKQFSMYMAYGGTNFGLTAGANAGIHNLDYEPMITSYDYDGVITEQGRTTDKFDLTLSLMSKYIREPQIDVPDPIKTISFGNFTPELVGSLIEDKGQPFLRATRQLYFFEHPKIQMYNQGIVIYETYLNQSTSVFQAQIHDFAVVLLDGQFVANFSRIKTSSFQFVVDCAKKTCQLQIIVEAMGHNNYGPNQQQDKKGMLSCISMNNQTDQLLWNLYRKPIDKRILNIDKISKKDIKYPAIFKASLNLKQVGDTYIDMSNYKKGYVWVNGKNLGRYWDRGPQFRLYCPGVWLKKQDNEIVILQLLSQVPSEINGTHLLFDPVKKEQPLLQLDKLFVEKIDKPPKIETLNQKDITKDQDKATNHLIQSTQKTPKKQTQVQDTEPYDR